MADQTFTATADAGGTAVVTVRPGQKLRTWVITQVSVEMSTAPIGTACVIRKNGALVTPVVATGDAATGDPPVVLYGSDVLTITWTGATPGDVGTVLVFYDEVATR